MNCGETFFKKIYCRACHRGFTVVFPLSLFRLSVLLRKLTNVRGGPDVMQTNVVSIATLDAGTTPAAAP